MAGWGDSFLNAYKEQRAFRDRWPVADAALNFVPIAGQLAAIDDIQRDLSQGEYGTAALDAVGLVPAGRLLKYGIRGFDMADNAMRRAIVRGSGRHLVNDASDALMGASVGALSIGSGAYTADLIDRQIKQSIKPTEPR